MTELGGAIAFAIGCAALFLVVVLSHHRHRIREESRYRSTVRRMVEMAETERNAETPAAGTKNIPQQRSKYLICETQKGELPNYPFPWLW